MAREASSRLELAKRRNQRTQALPTFADGLRRAVASELDVESRLLPLPESTDFERRLHAKLDELRAASALEEVRTSDQSRLGAEVERFLGGADEREYKVLLCHWMHVGAIRLTARELLAGLTALLDWDGDTVLGGTDDLDAVFLLDVTEGGDGPARYEIAYWSAAR